MTNFDRPIEFAPEDQDQSGEIHEVDGCDDTGQPGVVAGVIAEVLQVEREDRREEYPSGHSEDHPRPDPRKPRASGWQKDMRREQRGGEDDGHSRVPDQSDRNRRGVEFRNERVQPRARPRRQDQQVADQGKNYTGEDDHDGLQQEDHDR